MSEKGVLSKSIANNISETIIDKLGGTGYAPTEWSKNINLLGIASADIEEALASITEYTSSSDKGLLSLSIASDMGAMLNKKYNTSRGFKPSEVSSAVSALIPLPEKTAAGSIVTFSDGADEVPLKSCEVTLPASLDGYSAIGCTQMGKNLLDNQLSDGSVGGIAYSLNSDGSISCVGTVTNTNSTRVIATNVKLPVGNYVLSGADTSISLRCTIFDKDGTYTARNDTGNGVTVSVTATTDYLEFRVRARNTDEEVNTTIYPQFEAGSTPSSYEKCAPTVSTVNLGRTICGGTVDVVNGTGKETHAKMIFTGADAENWSFSSSGGNSRVFAQLTNAKTDTNTFASNLITPAPSASGYPAIGTGWINNNGRIVIGVDSSITSASDWKTYLSNNNMDIAYELADEYKIDFTFTGQEIPTRLGYNAFWSDEGDTEVTYRADLDLYEVPSTLSDTNNTETEGNEEQEVNE